jgi:single-stranded DNA-binding protein
VLVEGETRTRSWNDKETGQKHYRTEVVVTPFGGSIVLLGGGNGKRAAEVEASDVNPQEMPGSEEDIPF